MGDRRAPYGTIMATCLPLMDGTRSAAEVAEAVGTSANYVRQLARSAGRQLLLVRNRCKGLDKVNTKRQAQAERARAKLKDRRRVRVATPPTGQAPKLTAAEATGTMHPGTVLTWDATVGETILKDGRNNSKIGGDVLVGALKGARIFTLALEERATCPRTCQLWRTCYGNNLHRTRRWSPSPAFERALSAEVHARCAEHETVLVRLHVLGDFYSLRYLALWVGLLDDLPNLHVFGFTAHGADSKLGAGMARVRAALGPRFSIRHSGASGRWGSFTVDFPTTRKRLGDAVVCPEQVSAMEGAGTRHCGSCAVCWQTDRPVVFVEH